MSGNSSAFPAPIYRDTILAHIFKDAKRMFFHSLLEIDYAHVVMLSEQNILSAEATKVCLTALNTLDRESILATEFDGSVEDLFFLIEKRLDELCGPEHAGKIHTARSRNDIDMTMYRMVLRNRLLHTLNAADALRARVLALAIEHRTALMPAYTHNQPAQPITLGHYLMAFVEILERDAERLRATFVRVNRSPLGACAITTTGFPIRRERTAELLGFEGLQTNSYGAIASVDYLTESCSVLAVMMLNVGRLTQDLLLWSTAEFGFLRLSDGYVQTSSIMPQKRNPVPLEHVRILSSRAMSESQAVLNSLHNTPFADMNDSEDSLQPLVEVAFADGLRALTLLEGVLSETGFNLEHMRERAHGDFLTVTELADTLVRTTAISFRQAHGVVAAAIKSLNAKWDRDRMVTEVEKELAALGVKSPSTKTLQDALDPENFIAIRAITGGPAPAVLDAELKRASMQLDTDREWTERSNDRLQHAQKQLHLAADALRLG